MKKAILVIGITALFIMTIFAGATSVTTTPATTVKTETTSSNGYLIVGLAKDKEDVHFTVCEVTAVNLWIFDKGLIPTRIDPDTRIQVDIIISMPALLWDIINGECGGYLVGRIYSEDAID
jgi:hypothetical protein